jgi:cyclopropane fatty-acyl-phospholipid synthase-like methyltransferase
MTTNITQEFRDFWHQPSLQDAMHKRVLTNCSTDGIKDPLEQKKNWNEDTTYNQIYEDIKLLNLNNNDTILDFGCGVGRISKQLLKMNFNVMAVDVSPSMLEYAKEYIGINNIDNISFVLTDGFGCGDVAFLSCDAAISYITFQHMTSLEMVESNMKDINRILKIGGKIIIQHYIGGPSDPKDCKGFCGLNISINNLEKLWTKYGFKLFHTKIKPVIHNNQHFIVYGEKVNS